MILIAFIVGLLLPTLVGWLVLRLLENAHPVLLRAERWVLGCVFGLTLTMFVVFLLNIATGLPLTLVGFLTAHTLLLVPLGALWWLRRKRWNTVTTVALAPSPPMRTWQKVLVGILGMWLLARMLAAAAMLIGAPTYFDDAVDIWNFRGKQFFAEHRIVVDFPLGSGQSYPPAIPMVKTWLSTLAGTWSEPLVNGLHLVWSLGILLLLYWTLRRKLSRLWSLLGVYILGSIPFFAVHVSSSYADLAVAAHLLPAVSLAFLACGEGDPARRRVTLAIAALATALLTFTKNEGLVMHVPVILLVTLGGLLVLRRLQWKDALLYLIPIALVALPWILFKWSHGLTFGNNRALPSLMAPQWITVYTLSVNTFYQGSWALFFPLFLGLLLAQWRTALRNPIAVLTGYVLLLLVGQVCLFLFTGLSLEANEQTGAPRGVLQVMPVAVLLAMMLLAQMIKQKAVSGKQEGIS